MDCTWIGFARENLTTRMYFQHINNIKHLALFGQTELQKVCMFSCGIKNAQ